MGAKREFARVYPAVEKVLKEDVRAREDDKWLTWRVMREFTDIFIPFEDFSRIPCFESVSRIRRFIQNGEGRFQPSLRVQAEKIRKEVEVKRLMLEASA